MSEKKEAKITPQVIDWRETIEKVKSNFTNVSEEKFKKVFQNLQVKSPKITQQKFDDCGIYNAVAVDHIPAQVVSIVDSGKEKITWKIVGQQIVCNRILVPPLMIEYISESENKIWLQELLSSMSVELRK